MRVQGGVTGLMAALVKQPQPLWHALVELQTAVRHQYKVTHRGLDPEEAQDGLPTLGRLHGSCLASETYQGIGPSSEHA